LRVFAIAVGTLAFLVVVALLCLLSEHVGVLSQQVPVAAEPFALLPPYERPAPCPAAAGLPRADVA